MKKRKEKKKEEKKIEVKKRAFDYFRGILHTRKEKKIKEKKKKTETRTTLAKDAQPALSERYFFLYGKMI